MDNPSTLKLIVFGIRFFKHATTAKDRQKPFGLTGFISQQAHTAINATKTKLSTPRSLWNFAENCPTPTQAFLTALSVKMTFGRICHFGKAGRTTHLGAAMAQGKTTLIQETGCEIATRDEKFFIICVPRISLALNIASKLNRQYGEGAFGIYYESSRYKQHGRIGAVCTLTSLPLIFQEEWNDLEPQDCLIFIDEMILVILLTNW